MRYKWRTVFLSGPLRQKKHALANRWYCIALLSVVFFLSAYNRCADNSAAADEQKCVPQNEIAAVTGFWRGSISQIVGLVARLRRRTRCGNFNSGLLIATDGAFLVFGASRGCGGFLIICYGICHGIVCTGFIFFDCFRSIYDQCAVVLRGLNDGYSMAVSGHIRKRDVYISCVRLLSFINLHLRSIGNISGFIHRQG